MRRNKVYEANLRKMKISLILMMKVKKIIETMIIEPTTLFGAAESKVEIVVLEILNNKS